MKKLLALLLALAVVLSLAACGVEKSTGDENPTMQSEQKNEAEEKLPEASTKTLGFFQKFLSGGEYTMEMKTTAEGMTVTMKSAYKGDMIYSESNADGMTRNMIMRDGYQYIIDHNAKSCIKMQIMDTSMQNMFADEAENYNTATATGKTEYNGKTYDYEEFIIEGETVQYLFEGDDLKIIKANVMGTESVVEILSLTKGADAKLFEIPEDYQMISY